MAQIRIELDRQEIRAFVSLRLENVKHQEGRITGDVVLEVAGQEFRFPFDVADNVETTIPNPVPNLTLRLKVRIKTLDPLVVCASGKAEFPPFPPVQFPEKCFP